MSVICGSFFFAFFLQVGDCLYNIALLLRGFSKVCVHHIYATKYCVIKIKGVLIAFGKIEDGEGLSSHGSLFWSENCLLHS